MNPSSSSHNIRKADKSRLGASSEKFTTAYHCPYTKKLENWLWPKAPGRTWRRRNKNGREHKCPFLARWPPRYFRSKSVQMGKFEKKFTIYTRALSRRGQDNCSCLLSCEKSQDIVQKNYGITTKSKEKLLIRNGPSGDSPWLNNVLSMRCPIKDWRQGQGFHSRIRPLCACVSPPLSLAAVRALISNH